MLNRFFQQELSHLRDLAAEFSRLHPALAPMLSGPTKDPDVERLLEGTAFLTGLLRCKLDDDFPELIHGLAQLTFPHSLRPVPSTSMVVFSPKSNLKETMRIPAGTALASIPIEGTKCLFRTCYDLDVHPLTLTSAKLAERTGGSRSIQLSLQLSGLALNKWRPKSLRLHVSGQYAEATNLFELLLTRTERIVVRPLDGGSPLVLPPIRIKPAGFGRDEALLPYPSQAFPGYRIIQEYFTLPEKFLFLDISGLDGWQDPGAGSRFEIHFELGQIPNDLPRVGAESFQLFATPVVNVFTHDAAPIRLDHRASEHRILPEGGSSAQYQVFSVEKVVGIAQGSVKTREYTPFEIMKPSSTGSPVHYINRRISPVSGLTEVLLSVAYPPGELPPERETLAVSLLCTNAQLPERLRLGDINQPTSTSPELCEFRNIRQPTPQVEPPMGRDQLWRLLSHMTLNLMSLADASNLREILKLSVHPSGRDRTLFEGNMKRLDGIEKLSVKAADRLVRGLLVRGNELSLTLNPDSFASRGDMYLFGCILDYFLGTYAQINTFTQLTVQDALKGDTYRWPARAGDKPLI
ncbi:type VI secretion protein, VC_A0110 family [Desulfocurvibacter africanus PCS]|uniref:Type VI secretion protein, VC_A0110 family n=1 Tax=Desulfocurvibacter africanus PCS TaxID=1262666 RepID=M5Q2A5_DESAF|nr:type VI secretion system baseplate subunit TssF [Desulfocurvibacter africanus]EMG38281.1 type VI secretion protein, VC_A0110 family [Desulfocurvibacter africanus PCS]